MLLLYAVILGAAVGLLTGGRFSGLAATQIRLWPVALAGLAFQALLFSHPVADNVGRLGPSLYVASTTLVLMALVVNLRQPGFWLIACGALLNFVVVLANNGQMPASPGAVAALLGDSAQLTGFVNSIPLEHAVLWPLGDIFVLPHPIPLANVFSIGDVLIGLGGALFVVRSMRQPENFPATAGRQEVRRA